MLSAEQNVQIVSNNCQKTMFELVVTLILYPCLNWPILRFKFIGSSKYFYQLPMQFEGAFRGPDHILLRPA